MQPSLLTVKEAAKRLSVSPSTIRRMLRDGELAERRIRGAIRIPSVAIEALCNCNDSGEEREPADNSKAQPSGNTLTKRLDRRIRERRAKRTD